MKNIITILIGVLLFTGLIISGCALKHSLGQEVFGQSVPDNLKMKVKKGMVVGRDKKDGEVKYLYAKEKINKKANEVDRTNNSFTVKTNKKDKNGNDIMRSVISGRTNQYVKIKDDWYETGYATTTNEVYDEEMKLSFWEKFLGISAYADSMSTTSHSGDGNIKVNDNSWAGALAGESDNEAMDIDWTTGDLENTTRARLNGAEWIIQKSYFVFDTGRSIPDGAVISSSSITIYVDNIRADDGATSTIVETSQASITQLEAADWSDFGTTRGTNEAEGDNSTAMDMTANVNEDTYRWYLLSATGRSWIKDANDASSCGGGNGFTCLGLSNSRIIDEAAPTGDNFMTSAFSESVVGHEPHLYVEWAAAGNNAPTISTVTDTPDPVVQGRQIEFSVDWNDADAEGVKMFICDTRAFVPATPACGGEAFCSSSTDYFTADPLTCATTTYSSDIGTQNYYAFVCDNEPECSATSTGSFTTYYNTAPQILTSSDTPDPLEIGSTTRISATWEDADSEGVKMYVCKTDAISTTTPGCTGGQWCASSSEFTTISPIVCDYTTQAADTGYNNYYVYLCDDEVGCSTSTTDTFRVNRNTPANMFFRGNMDVSGNMRISALPRYFNAEWGFTSHTVDSSGYDWDGTQVCDMDDDGDYDIVSTTGTNGTCYWYKNDGSTPTPGWTKYLVRSGITDAEHVDCYDFDDDGVAEVITVDQDSNTVYLSHSNTDPPTNNWSHYGLDTSAGYRPHGTFIMDVDEDGYYDLVYVHNGTAGSWDTGVYWQRYNGGTVTDMDNWDKYTMTKWYRPLSGERAYPHYIAQEGPFDIDQDGDERDLIISCRTGSTFNTKPTSTLFWISPSDTKPASSCWDVHPIDNKGEHKSITVGNFFGNSDLDILAPNSIYHPDGGLYVWSWSSGYTSSTSVPTYSGATSWIRGVKVFDWGSNTGHGRDQFFASDSNGTALVFYEWDGSEWQNFLVQTANKADNRYCTFDLDGDNKDQLILSSSGGVLRWIDVSID